MSFPAFSGLFPNFIAAAAAAPDEIPICRSSVYISAKKYQKGQKNKNKNQKQNLDPCNRKGLYIQ